jgi:hypothetical protein
MLATGLDSPLISIATPVHPSATASRMAVFTVCASWATLQVMDSLMVRCDACCTYKVSPSNALQATENVNR